MTTRREFWPQTAFGINIQSLLHAKTSYLRDIPQEAQQPRIYQSLTNK